MMVPERRKRSLNLSFDFVHGGQHLGGYRTLNLLNVNSDPTFVRPVLYAQIANDYIAAPKASFVRVVINGESWGVYVSAQQYNQGFPARLLRDRQGRPLEGAGQPRRTRRDGVPRRRSGRLQAPLRDQDEGRRQGVGRPDPHVSVLNETPPEQ